MQLTIIGASGSFPAPRSPASCYLVSANGVDEHGQPKTWRIILDMGNGALGTLQRYLALEDIDAIMLSHLHPDHFMDLCGLHIVVRWNPNGWDVGRIPVYGPADTADRIAIAYGLDPDPGMHPDFDFIDWQVRQPVEIGPLKITPYPVRHPIDEAYALRVEATETTPDGEQTTSVLTYSGDTDTAPGLVEAAQGADLFLCEAAFHEGRDDAIDAGRRPGTRARETAPAADVGRRQLTHIPVRNDPLVTAQEARTTYDGQLAVAVSGVTYTV